MGGWDLCQTILSKGFVSNHSYKVERPPEVRRGEAADTMTITHESFSVFKPNPVAKVQQVKASNIAGWIGLRALTNSTYITMVWRFSGFVWSIFECFLLFFIFLMVLLVLKLVQEHLGSQLSQV